MDVNKGRFAEIFPVVTTAYKSTPLMDFVAVLMVLHYHKCEPLIFQRFFIISFLADSGAFVLKVSLFVFLNGELAQYGQSVRLLNGRSQVQILYSPILFCQMTGNIKQKVVNYNNSD